MNRINKTDSYITMESFGSNLPENWSAALAYMNTLIDELEEDDSGTVDRDEVDAIWQSYCHGEYDKEIAEIDEM